LVWGEATPPFFGWGGQHYRPGVPPPPPPPHVHQWLRLLLQTMLRRQSIGVVLDPRAWPNWTCVDISPAAVTASTSKWPPVVMCGAAADAELRWSAVRLILDHVHAECPQAYQDLTQEAAVGDGDESEGPPSQREASAASTTLVWTSKLVRAVTLTLCELLAHVLPPLPDWFARAHQLTEAFAATWPVALDPTTPVSPQESPAPLTPVDDTWLLLLDQWAQHCDPARPLHPAFVNSPLEPVQSSSSSPDPQQIVLKGPRPPAQQQLDVVIGCLDILGILLCYAAPPQSRLALQTLQTHALGARVVALLAAVSRFDTLHQAPVPVSASQDAPVDAAAFAVSQAVHQDPWAGRGAAQRESTPAASAVATGSPPSQSPPTQARPEPSGGRRAPPFLKVMCLKLLCALAADTLTLTGRPGSDDPTILTSQRWMQEFVTASDTVPLLLQHTLIEADNPYLREHVVLLLRVLSDGHPGVTRAVRAMEMRGLANEAELRAQGLHAAVQDDKIRVRSANHPSSSDPATQP
jgi:hypothetical protein